MHPLVHLAVTGAAAFSARRRLGRNWPFFLSAGVLADLDHLAWHARYTGQLNPRAAWHYFRDEGKRRGPAAPLPLHAWPLIGAVLLVGMRFQPARAIAAGLALHRLLDDLDSAVGPWWRSHATRRRVALHRRVFQRAGWRCESCGATDVRLHAHHRVQREDGGTDVLDNLIALCEPCHRLAHGLSPQVAGPDAVAKQTG